ncbi:MAG TPA: hypothetical protein PKB14_11015 [Rubrivivax sp.]|nr:hypothetical protein [Rubrivivax sp.]
MRACTNCLLPEAVPGADLRGEDPRINRPRPPEWPDDLREDRQAAAPGAKAAPGCRPEPASARLAAP